METSVASSEARASAPSKPRRRRVLVTEDNGALRQLLADVLKYAGYSVTQAADANEMQSAILRSRGTQGEDAFDLIVSDVFMPGKSGLDALSELRECGLRSRFLVITAFPEAATERRIVELGAVVLAKPFSLTDFRSVTASLLPQAPDSKDEP